MGFYLKKQKVGFTRSWERAEQKIASFRNGRSRGFAVPFLRRGGEGCFLKDYLGVPSALRAEYIHKLPTLLIPSPSFTQPPNVLTGPTTCGAHLPRRQPSKNARTRSGGVQSAREALGSSDCCRTGQQLTHLPGRKQSR